MSKRRRPASEIALYANLSTVPDPGQSLPIVSCPSDTPWPAFEADLRRRATAAGARPDAGVVLRPENCDEKTWRMRGRKTLSQLGIDEGDTVVLVDFQDQRSLSMCAYDMLAHDDGAGCVQIASLGVPLGFLLEYDWEDTDIDRRRANFLLSALLVQALGAAAVDRSSLMQSGGIAAMVHAQLGREPSAPPKAESEEDEFARFGLQRRHGRAAFPTSRAPFLAELAAGAWLVARWMARHDEVPRCAITKDREARRLPRDVAERLSRAYTCPATEAAWRGAPPGIRVR